MWKYIAVVCFETVLQLQSESDQSNFYYTAAFSNQALCLSLCLSITLKILSTACLVSIILLQLVYRWLIFKDCRHPVVIQMLWSNQLSAWLMYMDKVGGLSKRPHPLQLTFDVLDPYGVPESYSMLINCNLLLDLIRIKGVTKRQIN